MRIGINCGHTVSGQPGCGAVRYLNESNETRAVGYLLMEMLRQQGHTVVDCTDDYAKSAHDNLERICCLANAQPLDMFLSIHFNAGGGQGVECWTYGSADVCNAGKIKHAIAMLGFRNRGIKDGSHLYVIKNTKAPSVLVEVCFVDTKADAELYQSVGAARIAAAICEGITGKKPETEELTMNQYEELDERVKKLENPMVYNYIDDNMPGWARPTIAKMCEKGILKGDENGLNLRMSDLRFSVMLDRAGVFDK